MLVGAPVGPVTFRIETQPAALLEKLVHLSAGGQGQRVNTSI